MIDLAVIIVSWNSRPFLAGCLSSVYAELARSGLAGQVWVVDNDSSDGSLELVADQFPEARCIAGHNIGFGAANNRAMVAAAAERPRYFFLLNPDTVLGAGSLAALVDCLAQRPSAGMCGARLVYGDGRFQHSAFHFPGLLQLAYDLFPLPGRGYESRWNGRYPRSAYEPDRPPFPVDCILGATMLVRRDVAEATGGFDESFHMYAEEIDWCWRIRAAGWGIYAVPGAEVVHFGGESTRQVPAQSLVNLWQSRAHLYGRHHGPLTRAAAGLLARTGLLRKAGRTEDPVLGQAYRQAAVAWSGKNHHGGQ